MKTDGCELSRYKSYYANTTTISVVLVKHNPFGFDVVVRVESKKGLVI